MTQLDVYRGVPVVDAYGDPQMPAPADWPLWKSFTGFVGWGNPDEPLEPGRNTVITNRTAYVRGSEASGILATDQVGIDGVRYAVDGTVGEWVHLDRYVGAQFALKAVGNG